MDKNIQSKNEESGLLSNQIKKEENPIQKAHFLHLIKPFIQLIGLSKSLSIKYLSKGFRIVLSNEKECIQELNRITSQIYNMNFKQFQAYSHRFGFSISRKKRKNFERAIITFRLSEPLLFGNPTALNEDLSSQSSNQEEQIGDDFPKEEQIEQIMKLKEEKMRGFVKPNMFLSKFQSDGALGLIDRKRFFDDNSLEVKLYEQDLFSTPLANNRKNTSSHRHSEEEPRQTLPERNVLYKENYQKCSKLIDSAMIEILTAHRSKKIGEKADELLGKVIEIYDILSDNIENVNATVQQFEGKGGEKKQNQIGSPGFKPLNGFNDNLK